MTKGTGLPCFRAGVGTVGLRQKREGPLAGTEDETDWAGLLLKVRDQQDRAAYSALFQHFAPRVKAFLMRSGAGAALAEELSLIHISEPTRPY